jgi:nitrite reductase/ring-hydroxylating ferredoxin subunit
VTEFDDAGWAPLCPLAALSTVEGRSFVHEGRAVAAFRRGDVVHVVSDRCPHNGRTLHDGHLDGGLLTCRWHGWRFDVTTGRSPDVPPGEEGPRLRVYEVRLRDGRVEIRDPGPGRSAT